MTAWQAALWVPFLIASTVGGIGVVIDSSNLRCIGLLFGLVTFAVLVTRGVVRLFQWP